LNSLAAEFLQAAAWISFAIYAGVLIYAAASDLVTFEIPNWASVVALVAFFVVAGAAGLGAAEIGAHLSAGAAILVVGFLMYLKGMSGAGDVKLLAATAVWVGWRPLFEFLVVIALAGGMLALVILAYRRFSLGPQFAAVSWLAKLHEKDCGIPYGIAICLAALYLLPYLPMIETLRAP